MAVLGGTREEEEDGVLVIQGKRVTLLTPNTEINIVDFLFLTSSPWTATTENQACIAILREHGTIFLNQIGKNKSDPKSFTNC